MFFYYKVLAQGPWSSQSLSRDWVGSYHRWPLFHLILLYMWQPPKTPMSLSINLSMWWYTFLWCSWVLSTYSFPLVSLSDLVRCCIMCIQAKPIYACPKNHPHAICKTPIMLPQGYFRLWPSSLLLIRPLPMSILWIWLGSDSVNIKAIAAYTIFLRPMLSLSHARSRRLWPNHP